VPVTLEEVAKAANVSVATVSRALTNSHHPMSETTKQRVVKLAQEMGYMPNLVARSLRTDRTNTVGVIIDDMLSPFVPPIVRGIQDYLKGLDILGLVVNSDLDPEIEKDAINKLISHSVDGIIFVESWHRGPTKELEKSKRPYVFVHRLFGSSMQNSVVPDDFYSAALVIKHLVSLGHWRIAHIKGPERWHSSQRRLVGYQAELEAQGLGIDPTIIQNGDWEPKSGYEATQNLLGLKEPPTAIFAANDMMALGAIYAIQDAGLNVPEDIAVVGYDNQGFTRIVRPYLTTVSLPAYRMGQRAAELLCLHIEGQSEEVDEIKVPGRLYIRESCGADESLRTKDELNVGTTFRRILLGKQPENE
jgi:DNA-binding LacI/PurR family transcriptional regulator